MYYLEWIPRYSGCYRPFYYDNVSSDATENKLVSALEPELISVSTTSFDDNNAGYDEGKKEGKNRYKLSYKLTQTML